MQLLVVFQRGLLKSLHLLTSLNQIQATLRNVINMNRLTVSFLKRRSSTYYHLCCVSLCINITNYYLIINYFAALH